MDKITISDLRVPTIIGVYAHERTTTQQLEVTVTLAVNIEPAAKSDAIEDALDYSKIRESILCFGKKAKYQLIEAFISDLADYLKQHFQLSWVQLSVTKKPTDMPDVSGVTLMIER